MIHFSTFLLQLHSFQKAILEIAIINFTSDDSYLTHYLFDLLFMRRVKDVSLVLFQLFLVYFVLLKVQKFLKITFFSLSKRKSVKKLTQLSTKISKFSYFSFTFKLNGKKKMPLKNIVWRRELQEKFCWRRDLI